MQWLKVYIIKTEKDEDDGDKGYFLFISFEAPSKESGKMWH